MDLLRDLLSNNIFIWVEGENLKLSFGTQKTDQSVIQRVKEHKEALIAFLTEKEVFSKVSCTNILGSTFSVNQVSSDHGQIMAIHPVSGLQQGLLHHRLIKADDDAYLVQMLLDFNAPLNCKHFQEAWRLSSIKHPVLRTAFNWSKSEIVQVVLNNATISDKNFKYSDISHHSEIEQETIVAEIVSRDRLINFELNKPAGAIRFNIIKRSEDKYSILITNHHIILDGWSMPILLGCVFDFYKSLQMGSSIEVEADNSYFEAQTYFQNNQVESERYWATKDLTKANSIDNLLDRKWKTHDSQISHENHSVKLFLSHSELDSLQGAVTLLGLTLNAALQFAWHKILQVYNNAEQTIVGTTLSGRNIPVEGIAESVGMFINSLPLAITWSDQDTVADVLHQIQQEVGLLNTHSNINLAKLQKSGESLFHSLIVYENYPVKFGAGEENKTYQDTQQSAVDIKLSQEKVDYPLYLVFNHERDGLSVELTYFKSHLQLQSANRLLQRVKNILLSISDSCDIKHHELDFLVPEEKLLLSSSWRKNEQSLKLAGDNGGTLHNLVNNQLKNNSCKIAVVNRENKLTYGELYRWSDNIANALITLQNPSISKKRIALYMDRGEEMIATILGVLKAGYCYIPLATNLPADRIQFIINDCCPDIVLASESKLQELADKLTEKTGPCNISSISNLVQESAVESSNMVEVTPDDLAYIMYTSGSTGRPKGVMVSHGAAVNTVLAMTNIYEIRDGSYKCGFFSQYVFDVSISEIFNCLGFGGELHIFNDDVRNDVWKLNEYLLSSDINYVFLPPAILAELPKQNYPSLKAIVFAGEPCDQKACLYWAKHYKLYNCYGPTEAAVYTTSKLAEERNLNEIGKPLANVEALVLNNALKLVPIGAPGELYIGGRGLANGYLNLDELTDSSFIQDPLSEEPKRLYRTGDIVRWLSDGNLEYLGRQDSQIKLRGFRIELSEIQSALTEQPDVLQALVTLKHRGKKPYLAAYVITNKSGQKDPEKLKLFLTDKLPDYMVPETITFIDKIPLNTSGKIDYENLPEDVFPKSELHLAPVSELQIKLSNVFKELLNIDEPGLTDNFFRIGGDSITAIQLVARLRKAGFEVSVSDIYSAPTIERLAQRIEKHSNNKSNAEQGTLSGTFGLLPIQSQFYNEQFSEANHWNQSFAIKIPAEVDTHRINKALEVLANDHDMLRVTFDPVNKTQTFHEVVPGGLPDVQQIDLRGISEGEIERYFNEFQQGLNLKSGPLWRVLLVKNLDGTVNLAFTFHHLIIDVVSWGIIAADLKRYFAQGGKPAKSASYRQRVTEIENYAALHSEEEAFWLNMVQQDFDFPEPEPANHRTVELDLQYTELLLTTATRGFNTDANQLIIASLSNALTTTFGQHTFLVGMEGHGRHQLSEELDYTDTVGWFTNFFPIALTSQEELSDTIISCKELMNSIPNKGIGFGAFQEKVLANSALPRIAYNYLGNAINQNDEDFWTLQNEFLGITSSEKNQSRFLLNLNGFIHDDCLGFSISSQLSEELTQKFADAFYSSLVRVIECCNAAAKTGGVFTSSDFPYVGISQNQLNKIQDSYAVSEILPASSLQKGFIYHLLAEPNDDAYCIQTLWDYYEDLNINAYREAWKLAVMQFPALRVAFDWQEEIVQIITREDFAPTVPMDIIDIVHMEQTQQQSAISHIVEQDRAETFDLKKTGLLRIKLIKRSDTMYSMLFTIHHAIIDGWSRNILLQTVHAYYGDLNAGYVPIVNGEEAYVKAQRFIAKNAVDTECVRKEIKNQLNVVNDINVLLDNPVNLEQYRIVKKPTITSRLLGDQKVSDLHELCKVHQLTPNVVLQFCWHKILQVYCGDGRTVVGTTVSGRDIPVDDIEQSVGMYINTLPLVLQWKEDEEVLDTLQRLQTNLVQINTNSSIALADLQEQGKRLFHTLFVYENYPQPKNNEIKGETEGLKFDFKLAIEKIEFPLSVTINNSGSQLVVNLHYDAELISEQKAEQFVSLFDSILSQIVATPTMKQDAIELTDHEQLKVLTHQSLLADDSLEQLHILKMFDESVANFSDCTALVFEEHSFTYQQLDQLAGSAAHRLLNEISSGRFSDKTVALIIPRSHWQVIGILGILRAGAAYVPIDSSLPKERIQYILDDCRAEFIYTTLDLVSDLSSLVVNCHRAIKVLDITSNCTDLNFSGLQNPSYNVNDLSYVIYTSGTTGLPKGVMIEQQGFANSIRSDINKLKVTPDSRFLHCVSFNFDAATSHLFMTLCAGACVYLASNSKTDLDSLSDEMISKGITHTAMPVSMLKALPQKTHPDLRVLVTGGEFCPPSLVEFWTRQNLTVFNAYGPTEVSITSSIANYSNEEELHTIGRPIDNLACYVLNEKMQPVPKGVEGELFISGIGVARGYLNCKELTASRFVANPFLSLFDAPVKARHHQRLYKTGDIVRWNNNNLLEFVGRGDNQVKINGYRIETGEIESALVQNPEVQQAVVVVKTRGESKYLAAYIKTINGTALASLNLKKELAKSLPEYMLPVTYTAITTIPLTVNGKLDVASLPDDNPASESDYTAPENELEEKLCEVWQSLLGLERISVNANFFANGGDSILCIRLAGKLKDIGFRVNVKAIYDAPTIRLLAEYLISDQNEFNIVSEQGALTGRFNLIPIQEWFFSLDLPVRNHWNQAFQIAIPKGLASETLATALEALAWQHDMLRSRFGYDKRDGRWYQEYLEGTKIAFELTSHNVTNMSEYEQYQLFSSWQGELDITTGNTWRAIQLQDSDNQEYDRLLLIFHHLIVDTVSWSIIAQDLRNCVDNKPLMEKGTSYRQWVTALHSYANKNSSQLDYWREVMSDFAKHEYSDESQNVAFSLTREKTTDLITNAPAGFNTEINDLLLSALALALAETFGYSSNHIMLELHGRKLPGDSYDVSSTVGWFTSSYPVRLMNKGSVKETIVATKEMLRNIPDNGIGYGAICAGHPEFKSNPKIVSNYLGQMEQTVSDSTTQCWDMLSEECGIAMAPQNSLDSNIVINSSIREGVLQFEIFCNLSAGKSKLLVHSLERAMIDTIDCAITASARGGIKTQSDFGFKQAAPEQLASIEKRLAKSKRDSPKSAKKIIKI